MKYFIPMIILSLVLLSCSKEESEEETTTELEGTWKTACYTNPDNTTSINTFIFAANVLTIKEQEYSDTACATVYSLDEVAITFSIGDAVTFANGKTGHKFTVTLGSTFKITPQSASAVSTFNTERECSVNGWVMDTAKVCDIDQDEAGKTFYGVYQLDGNNLYTEINDEYPDTSDVDTSDAENSFTKQ